MNKAYVEYVYRLIENQEIGKPIYTRKISRCVAETYNIRLNSAAKVVSVACKNFMDEKIIPELRSYQRGIYYRTLLTPFGEVGIDKEQLIEDRYLKNDSGYETGLIALHRLGLTTQMPNERTLVTNKACGRVRIDRKLGVTVKPPKIEVNATNKQYLKILDLLEILNNAPVDAEHPYKIIGEHIDRLGLEYDELITLANDYYDCNTISQLVHVVMCSEYYLSTDGIAGEESNVF